MKTKINSVLDWRQILKQIGWADAPTDDDIKRHILQELTRGKVTYVEQDPRSPIERSCRVTIKTQSVLSKFNKEKTVLTVGPGLYDRTLEAQLCGMLVGQAGQVCIKGEEVHFTILKVEKKQYPQLTDELVKDLQLEGIETLEAYRIVMEKKIKTEYADGLAQQLLEQLEQSAQMDTPAEEDILRVIDLEYEPLRARFSLDTLSAETWAKEFGKVELRSFYEQIYPDVARLFGTTSKESYYQSRQAAAKQTIRVCLLLNHILNQQMDPTEDAQAEKKLMQQMHDRLLQEIYGG